MEPLILKSEECQLGAAVAYRLPHRGRRVGGGRESEDAEEKEEKVEGVGEKGGETE